MPHKTTTVWRKPNVHPYTCLHCVCCNFLWITTVQKHRFMIRVSRRTTVSQAVVRIFAAAWPHSRWCSSMSSWQDPHVSAKDALLSTCSCRHQTALVNKGVAVKTRTAGTAERLVTMAVALMNSKWTKWGYHQSSFSELSAQLSMVVNTAQ